ncbi:MAG: hypothetical protein ACPGD5_01745 [Salibacteraceae bacterium]
MILKKQYLMFIVAVLAMACEVGDKRDESFEDVVLTDSVSERFTHELGTVRKNIEQNAGLYNRLFELKCPYNPDLPLPQNTKYDLTHQKAMGFGSYSASFVYSVSYEQAQEASNYLDFILSLSEELGIRNAFNESELRELVSNNTEIDKSAIITRIYLRATEQLYTEERAIIVSYMVLGGWLEGMKMTYETCGDYLDDEEIRLGIYDQTYTFYNCKRILETFKEDSEVKKILTILNSLEPNIEKVIKTRGDITQDDFNEMNILLSNFRKEIYK